jgi:hypothetical protein
MIGDGTSGGAIGICPTGSCAHFGCGRGEDDLVILSRGNLDPLSAGNASCQRRSTDEFRRPRDKGTAGRSGWGSRMPSLVARTVLHLDPPFALSTNMAARTHNTSLLIDARVVPSLVRDRPGWHDACRPKDAEALHEIRRHRHAASIPLENRLVPSSRRAVVVVPDDPAKRASCIDGFYTRIAASHRPVLASLQRNPRTFEHS